MEIFRDKRAKNTLKGIANDMQLEMNGFVSKQIAKATLTVKERMRLIGAGIRNYGFIDKATDIARDNPEFTEVLVRGREPTVKKLERDFHSLMRGTREGEIVIKNESPHEEGGKRVVVDEVV
jgi:hypothetical protein